MAAGEPGAESAEIDAAEAGAKRPKAAARELEQGSAREDLRAILRLGWPNSVSQVAEYTPGFAMLSFLGSDSEQLAAAGMGFMFANVAGISFIMGSGAGACGLISQAYGAGNWARCGDLLQRQLAIHAVLVLVVGALWLNTERLLLMVRQPALIARLTAEFVLWRVPALPFFAAKEDVKTFLLAQNLMYTPMVVSLVVNALTVMSLPLLIAQLGFAGAPLALTLANALQAVLLFALAPWVLPQPEAWPRWRLSSAFAGWGEMLRVSVPAGALMLSEWMGWETNLFFAGLLCEDGADCAELDVFPILSSTMVVAFMFHIGFSTAAATRVGNALGAGDFVTARRTSNVTLVLVTIISGAISAALLLLQGRWGRLFSEDPGVVRLTGQVLPLIAAYIFLDALGPGALVSLLRSMGVVRLPAIMSVLSFYAIGIPFGLWLTFGRRSEGWGIWGLWAGLVLGMLTMVGSLLAFQLCWVDWRSVAEDARARSQATPAAAASPKAAAEEQVLGKSAAYELVVSSPQGRGHGGAAKQPKVVGPPDTPPGRRLPGMAAYSKVVAEPCDEAQGS